MRLSRTGDFLTVGCPAKINLFLEVRGVRPDGFHEIETVMQAVTLYDDIVLRPRSEGGIAFRCSDAGVPSGAENLACRAAELLAREAGLPTGVSITLDKRIPTGAGLGGGSSDAAGVLAGLNELFGLGLNRARLCELAAELGSDVAFFLYGGTALCTGRGELVAPIPATAPAHYVICCPPVMSSTAKVYQNLSRLGLTRGKHSGSFMMQSLARGDFVSACGHIFNRLGEVAVSLAPEIGKVKQLLAQEASQAAFVSGSGSATYVMLDSAGRAAEVARRVRARDVGRVFLVEAEPPGAGPA